jgi:hypothetical protein
MNLFILWESINSVALSHPEGHDCDTCKAAAGDKDAFQRVVVEVFESEQEA